MNLFAKTYKDIFPQTDLWNQKIYTYRDLTIDTEIFHDIISGHHTIPNEDISKLSGKDGLNTLTVACMCHNVECVKYLLSLNITVNLGLSLWYACACVDIINQEIMELLIAKGADVNYTFRGVTPLFFAVILCQTNVISMLIKSKAHMQTVLVNKSLLWFAVRTNKHRVVSLLIDTPKVGDNPLTEAMTRDVKNDLYEQLQNMLIVKILKEKGYVHPEMKYLPLVEQMLYTKGFKLDQAFQLSCTNYSSDICFTLLDTVKPDILWLIEHHCNDIAIKVLSTMDKEFEGCMDKAISSLNHPLIKWLSDKVDIDKYMHSIIIHCEGDMNMIYTLVKHGAILNEKVIDMISKNKCLIGDKGNNWTWIKDHIKDKRCLLKFFLSVKDTGAVFDLLMRMDRFDKGALDGLELWICKDDKNAMLMYSKGLDNDVGQKESYQYRLASIKFGWPEFHQKLTNEYLQKWG